ncbi:MAG: hypothetical protein KY475_09945 [Planctomycetes bacterium]|nr:hypothetical protein [Planctomycetota bacterium]
MMPCRFAVWLSLLLTAGFASLADIAAAQDQPTAAARRAAEEIRREALLPPRGPEGRPLPLASHWNVGTVPGSFEPDHQIGLIQAGHHVLPWMSWPQGDPESERFDEYYGRLLRYFRELDLPVSFRGTQWNAMLVGKAYQQGPLSNWAGVIAPDGSRTRKLSPFGPLAPWKDPAQEYVATPAMRKVQELYPNPPRVLWVSNNEPPDLRWAKHGPLEEQSLRYLEKYGEGRSDEFKRQVVGEGWAERYPVMFDAMRAALTSDAWKKNVRFIGYDAFGPAHLGRWDGWKVYSLACERWTSPDWRYWDGGSPSYYTDHWHDKRDDQVFSTQVASMNWVFMLEEAWAANPDFWFEMSTWDGNEVKHWMEGLGVEESSKLAARSSSPLSEAERRRLSPEHVKKSKALQYMADGQDYPPERAAGWVQYGMWLVRPRVVREFRGHATPLAPVKPYWMETVKAVDRVYENPPLREFWRHGELIVNAAREHPYRTDVPERYQNIDRWHSLDTNLDPPRPWDLSTKLPVISLALVQGEAPQRRWLLYAHSPLEDRREVQITIPGYRDVKVEVLRRGVFYLVDEQTGDVKRIAGA